MLLEPRKFLFPRHPFVITVRKKLKAFDMTWQVNLVLLLASALWAVSFLLGSFPPPWGHVCNLFLHSLWQLLPHLWDVPLLQMNSLFLKDVDKYTGSSRKQEQCDAKEDLCFCWEICHSLTWNVTKITLHVLTCSCQLQLGPANFNFLLNLNYMRADYSLFRKVIGMSLKVSSERQGVLVYSGKLPEI